MAIQSTKTLEELASYADGHDIITENAIHFYDMSNEEYHALSSFGVVSKSMLAEMECPARFKWFYIDGHKEQDQDHVNLGSAVHTLALEPEKFHDRFYIIPKGQRRDKRTDAYKKCMAEAGERIMITHDDHETMRFMAESLAGNKLARAILEGDGKIESSIIWRDHETGEILRCRPDFLRDDGLIVDIKTTHSAEPRLFERTAFNLHYDVSAAMTSDGVWSLNGKKPDNYVFLICETKPPFTVQVRDCFRPWDDGGFNSLSYYEAGHYRFRKLLNRYIECKQSGEWPGYQQTIEPMAVPRYGMMELEKGEN